MNDRRKTDRAPLDSIEKQFANHIAQTKRNRYAYQYADPEREIIEPRHNPPEYLQLLEPGSE